MNNFLKSRHAEMNPYEKIIHQLIAEYCTKHDIEKTVINDCPALVINRINDASDPSKDRKLILFINIYKMNSGKWIIRADHRRKKKSMDFIILFRWESAFMKLLQEIFRESKGRKVIEDSLVNKLNF